MNIPEILVANGTGIILVAFLFLLRVRNSETKQTGAILTMGCWRSRWSPRVSSMSWIRKCTLRKRPIIRSIRGEPAAGKERSHAIPHPGRDL